MKCDQCGKEDSSFYGKPDKTENGTYLPTGEKLCFECYCEKYGLPSSESFVEEDS